jgi:FAD/FMN-containing dehydrogenase
LLEAEVVTADGQVRIANASTNPDLFWALKGGGGGTFGVVSKMTLRVHDLPEYFGPVNFTIKAASDDDYRHLIRQFVSFYKEHLFNDHWGEQVHVGPDNRLEIRMVSFGLDTEQEKAIWQPFLDWVARSSDAYSREGRVDIVSIPARHYWDPQWWKEHWPEAAFPRNGSILHALLDDVLLHVMREPALEFDNRPGADSNNAWWKGATGECAWFIWGYESLWIPASLLERDAQQRLADALFASSRYSKVELHLNKGLAGAPPDAIAGATDTAMNPAVLSAFALAIVGDAQSGAYPGIPGHEPSVAEGRDAAKRIDQCVDQLRAVAGETGAYVSESNYFEKNFQQAYWGSNYSRLAEIKKKYDPDGLFFVHNGVGSEQWSTDGFTKLSFLRGQAPHKRPRAQVFPWLKKSRGRKPGYSLSAEGRWDWRWLCCSIASESIASWPKKVPPPPSIPSRADARRARWSCSANGGSKTRFARAACLTGRTFSPSSKA